MNGIRKLRYRFCNKNTSSPLAMVIWKSRSVLDESARKLA
jgi:hypothetical protein